MTVGSMSVGQVSGITCPQMVPRSRCGSELQKPPAVVALGLSQNSRMDSSTLRLVRPSSSIAYYLQSRVISSSCMLQGIRCPATLGNPWRIKGGVRCQLAGASSSQEDELGSDENAGGAESVRLDLNLPRRSALLEFTCNICTTRTQRVINPEAFRRGTVFVQCGGCEAYHKLVDNLNLVEEYDFRNEGDPMNTDSDL